MIIFTSPMTALHGNDKMMMSMIKSFTQRIALIATIKCDVTTKVGQKEKTTKVTEITFWYTMLMFEIITLHG